MKYVLKTIFENPAYAITRIGQTALGHLIPDSVYLRMLYRAKFGRKLDLKNPNTFNEKLQWLKLHDRKPLYTQMVDKYEAKKYVSERVGEDYIIPTLGVWDRFEDIDFEKLPNQFVLKCTHDSGGLIICRDKSKLNIAEAKEKISKSLKTNYYWMGREWPYKNVKPRIIAEKYMQDGENQNLTVYKIFNFAGVPKLFQVIQNDKTKHETIDYFDVEWNRLELRQNFPNSIVASTKPEQLEQMINVAKKLSEGFTNLRTDVYSIDGKIFFSEFTFFSDSGLAKFIPDEWDKILGDWILVPENLGGGIVLQKDDGLVWVHGRLPDAKALTDYKFFCFEGKPRIMYCSKDKADNPTTDFFDMDYNRLSMKMRDPNSEIIPDKPKQFEQMKMLAEKLAEGHHHLRVDFYEIGDQIYFGELTFFHCGGLVPIKPAEWEEKMGSWILL